MGAANLSAILGSAQVLVLWLKESQLSKFWGEELTIPDNAACSGNFLHSIYNSRSIILESESWIVIATSICISMFPSDKLVVLHTRDVLDGYTAAEVSVAKLQRTHQHKNEQNILHKQVVARHTLLLDLDLAIRKSAATRSQEGTQTSSPTCPKASR
jgi:hypothetical protein